jgi:predicted transcriptional regulator
MSDDSKWEIDKNYPDENHLRPKQGYKATFQHQLEIIRDYNIPTQEIESILKNPKFFDMIINEIQKKVVGEKTTLQAIFLNCCGIYVENHQITSYNILINDESGAGKDFILKKILEIFPKHLVVHRTRISPTAFTYWHDSKREPEWSWDGKICALMDVNNSVLNSDVFKVYCSDGSAATIVVNQFAREIIINGKPVMILTSYSANPNNEMLRRFPFITIDTTNQQTIAIKRTQALMATTGEIVHYEPNITESLGYLKRIKVKIPFAEKLPKHFPDSLIMRTHFPRFLDIIKASCALYQYQREMDEEGYYLATPQDYDNAVILIQKTTTNSQMIPLSKKHQKLLEIMKTSDEWRVQTLLDKVSFYVQSKLYIALDSLTEKGFLSRENKEVADSKRPVSFYKLTSIFTGFHVPLWLEICKIEGNEGDRGNEGNEGNEGINNNNSLNSLNSPLKMPQHFIGLEDK